jgi:uncharacterized protein YxeA
MKAFLVGVTAAVLIAIGAAFVLDTKVQQTAENAFQTQGVRL